MGNEYECSTPIMTRSCLQFFITNLAKKINARFYIRDDFDSSKICPWHLLNHGRAAAGFHTVEFGNFNDKTMGDPIIEFVCLRFKMYVLTVCEESESI